MINKVFALLGLLNKKEKRSLLFLLLILFIVGILEVVGIGSILPFLSVASNPEIIHKNNFLKSVYQFLQFDSDRSFLLFLGFASVFIIVAGNLLSAISTYYAQNFAHSRNHSLSMKLFENYLKQPYDFFIDNNSADMNKVILNEVQSVVKGVLVPGSEIISKIVLVVFIVIGLAYVDLNLSIISFSVLGGVYGVVYFIVRNKLTFYGRKRILANGSRFKITSEAFNGIKDVKILQKEEQFLKEFEFPSKEYTSSIVKGAVIGTIPNYLINILSFAGLLLICIYLIFKRESFAEAVPIIGLFAFAGYRLLPALKGIYTDLTNIRLNLPAVDKLVDDINKPVDISFYSDSIKRLDFTKCLEIRNISFNYSKSGRTILNDFSYKFLKNKNYGIVGVTGAGKTTLVDLILGLLIPSSGEILVDDIKLDKTNIFAWQRNIGYVPQQIFMSDNTVLANIAFGIPTEGVDIKAVERAASIANIHDFIVNELPDGYNTKIGERGIKLSGGQRQRIGIARALYNDPDLLIFDEATSSLDNLTESVIMDAINKLTGKKTIIIIAHRLTTVKNCYEIILIEKGELIGFGNYDQLRLMNEKFKNITFA